MVDVGEKPITQRIAVARGVISMLPATLQLIRENKAKKGDVLGVARLAGIMGSKQTSNLIPLCHLLPIDSVKIEFRFPTDSKIEVECRVSISGKTGVEMEALTAVSVACLTIYDMCKAVDRGMVIGPIELLEKSGGASGHFLKGEAGTGETHSDGKEAT